MIQAYADIINPFEANNLFVGRVVRRNWRGKEMWRRSFTKEHASRVEALNEAHRHAELSCGLLERCVRTTYV